MTTTVRSAEAATLLGVSQSTVQRMALAGKLGKVTRLDVGNGGLLILSRRSVEAEARRRGERKAARLAKVSK